MVLLLKRPAGRNQSPSSHWFLTSFCIFVSIRCCSLGDGGGRFRGSFVFSLSLLTFPLLLFLRPLSSFSVCVYGLVKVSYHRQLTLVPN